MSLNFCCIRIVGLEFGINIMKARELGRQSFTATGLMTLTIGYGSINLGASLRDGTLGSKSFIESHTLCPQTYFGATVWCRSATLLVCPPDQCLPGPSQGMATVLDKCLDWGKQRGLITKTTHEWGKPSRKTPERSYGHIEPKLGGGVMGSWHRIIRIRSWLARSVWPSVCGWNPSCRQKSLQKWETNWAPSGRPWIQNMWSDKILGREMKRTALERWSTMVRIAVLHWKEGDRKQIPGQHATMGGRKWEG